MYPNKQDMETPIFLFAFDILSIGSKIRMQIPRLCCVWIQIPIKLSCA